MRRRDKFLSMVEDAIRNPNISKSVQRFQLAIQSAKVRLDLAISPGLWLLPSKMVLNTESVVGYNNKLKKATTFMRIGVNSDLNIPVRRFYPETQSWVCALLNYHTLVLKRKTAEPEPSSEQRKSRWLKAEQRKSRCLKAKQEKQETVKQENQAKTKTVSTSHEANLNVLIIVAGGLAWFLFR